MAEDVNYASVVFKNKNRSRPEAKNEEETVYDEVKEKKNSTEQSPDTNDKKADGRRRHYRLLACCLVTFCVILLLGIIAICVYKKMNLTMQNQELEMEKRNLTNQINDMTTKGNELNISRAQWSIDAYCPRKDGGRQCKSCQPGWILFQSSCYVVLDYKTSTDRKTWEEARENCKIMSSDLVVVDNAEEKKNVSDNSYHRPGNEGYWIGLKADGRKWKWVDGSDLADSSWIETPTDGHCAISHQTQGWKSVKCNNRNNWICEQKALSV
ncbi:natural killer cells antigen CD94-like isoform X2 [Embiotoca jacksoni]|uniref:natural killer cells antigen CD94-like isoform X2 n=1 Tax=Embiotoca jacksoni TaxID=100190 RepID=UPI003703759A